MSLESIEHRLSMHLQQRAEKREREREREREKERRKRTGRSRFHKVTIPWYVLGRIKDKYISAFDVITPGDLNLFLLFATKDGPVYRHVALDGSQPSLERRAERVIWSHVIAIILCVCVCVRACVCNMSRLKGRALAFLFGLSA